MKPCRMINKIYWIFPAAALALAAAAYPFLPEQLVSYWGMDDGADASWHKAFLFAIPALLAFCAFVFTWLPTRRTSRQNRERFQKEAGILRVLFFLVILAVEILIILFGLGYAVDGKQIACLCCGAAVVVAGYFLPKLSSRGKKAQDDPARLCGKQALRIAQPVWMAGGIVFMTAGLIPGWGAVAAPAVALAAMLGAPGIGFAVCARQRR